MSTTAASTTAAAVSVRGPSDSPPIARPNAMATIGVTNASVATTGGEAGRGGGKLARPRPFPPDRPAEPHGPDRVDERVRGHDRRRDVAEEVEVCPEADHRAEHGQVGERGPARGPRGREEL